MAFVTIGPINLEDLDFIVEFGLCMGHRISACIKDPWEFSFLFQSLSVAICPATSFSHDLNDSAKQQKHI